MARQGVEQLDRAETINLSYVVSDRAVVQFPQPYGKTGVYWFDVAETYSLTQSFPVKLTKPGIWPVEQAIPTDLFASAMKSRGIKIRHNLAN